MCINDQLSQGLSSVVSVVDVAHAGIKHLQSQQLTFAVSLLIMANMGQEQEDSADDAVDEHGQQQQEGEEACAPLVVHHYHQDQHHCQEHYQSKVDVLCLHPAAASNGDVEFI